MAVQKLDNFLKEFPKRVPELLSKIQDMVPACGLPLYASLDLREAPWKLCAVDVNLFPGGFSLISEQHKADASRELQKFFAARLLKAAPWKLGLVPESHTNNEGYLRNILAIKEILEGAGAQVTVFWSGTPIPKKWSFRFGENSIDYHPLKVSEHELDAIILNHDLSGLKEDSFDFGDLPVFPNPALGWHTRKKSQHVQFTHELLDHLEKSFDWFDPWYFSPYHDLVSGFHFSDQESMNYLMERAELAFEKMNAAYKERGIQADPSLFIKNDSGTYGLGVSVFHSMQSLKENASSVFKRSFSSGKGRAPVSQLILQEAVPTIFEQQSSQLSWAAEPTLYFCNGKIIGGFFRCHETEKDTSLASENLNSPGSQFIDFSSKKADELFKKSNWNKDDAAAFDSFRSPAYRFVAKLHMVAAALEECPE